MLIPMGLHKGRPIDELPSPYLLWLVSQDHIRFSRWPMIEEILSVLGKRFSEAGKLLDELRVTEAPPAKTESPERKAERQAERAEKLRQLEARRLEERLARREAWRVAKDQADMKRASEKLRARLARNRQQATDTTLQTEGVLSHDFSDLV